MKKEELKNENSNDEYLDEDTKKMKKKFKSLSSWATLIEGVMIVPILLVIIIVVGTGINCLVSKKTNFMEQVVTNLVNIACEKEHEEGTPIGTEDYVKLAETIRGNRLPEVEPEDIDELKLLSKEDIMELQAIISIISTSINYFIVIYIINNLNNIFKNVEKEGTPFTEDNMKYLSRINKGALVLWIFGLCALGGFSIGLVAVIIIETILYIFRYGYKLQQEVDETI